MSKRIALRRPRSPGQSRGPGRSIPPIPTDPARVSGEGYAAGTAPGTSSAAANPRPPRSATRENATPARPSFPLPERSTGRRSVRFPKRSVGRPVPAAAFPPVDDRRAVDQLQGVLLSGPTRAAPATRAAMRNRAPSDRPQGPARRSPSCSRSARHQRRECVEFRYLGVSTLNLEAPQRTPYPPHAGDRASSRGRKRADLRRFCRAL
jgi:hypothetical protein